MMRANAKWMWAALWVVGVATAIPQTASAQAPYVTDTINGFESFCNGTQIPDGEFTTGWGITADARPVQPNLFSACGIESIDDIGQALGESAYLYRPSLGNPISDPLTGITGTALMGNVGTGIGGILITFRTPVNQLYVRVVDLDDPDDTGLLFTLEDENGAVSDATASAAYTFAGSVATLDGSFETGIKRIELNYGALGDNWAVDEIRFNTWSCGDGETESQAGNGNPADEQCDETNAVECDGCRTDCRTDVVGCLIDGTTCVEGTGTLDPDSGGCAACDVAGTPTTEVVGYNAFVAAGSSCTDDGLFCTGDQCDGAGVCTHPPTLGLCAIDGMCFTDGDVNPASECQFCDSATDGTTWANRAMGTSCDDGDACTDDTPDDASDEGDVCNDAGQCVGGANLDCNDNLSCTVDSCNANSGCINTLAAGCLIPSAGGDPICRSSGEINPDDECASCQPTVADDAWSVIGVGETCGDPVCMDGVLTPAPTCNAAGECLETPEQNCEGAICADAVSCTGDCDQDAECLSENYCEDGECLPEKPGGDPCTRGGECQSGFCADGVCCDASCDRACEACNLAGEIGVCTPHALGEDPEGDCPDEPEVQVCDGAGQCIDTDYPDGTECSVAGECESGNCVDGVCCSAPCDGVCEACNVEGREGTCRPYEMQTDPEGECEQSCNGAGQCVSYEVRGNGFCAARPWSTERTTGWTGWAALLGILLVYRRRRRARAHAA